MFKSPFLLVSLFIFAMLVLIRLKLSCFCRFGYVQYGGVGFNGGAGANKFDGDRVDGVEGLNVKPVKVVVDMVGGFE